MTPDPYTQHEADPQPSYPSGSPYPHTAGYGQAQPVLRGDRNGMGTAGLALGVVAALFALIPIIGVVAWFIAPVGLIFGLVGAGRAKRGEATNRGVAVAGIVTSSVALAICMLWLLATAAAAATGAPTVAPGASSTARQSAAAAPAAPAMPAGPASSFGDGTYQVGSDIAAGRYKTPGPPADAVVKDCYWVRTKDDSGQFDAIISNGNATGPGSVTVKKGEFFQTSGGCTWTKQ